MNVRSDRRPRRLLALALLLALLALVVPATAEAQQAEADILVAHAILAYDAGRYAEALDLLRQALAHEPDHVEALYYAGLAHLALQQPEAALAPLERAHGLAPADLAVQLQLGVASFVLKRDAQAERLLGRVFAEQPKTDGVGYYLGVVRYRRRDYRGALEAFRGGTSSDPEIQQLTRLYTGLTLAALGRREQALSEVDAALRLPSTSAVTSAAERLRDAVLTARAPVRPLQAEVRLGVYYDTNV
ncbi:MAG TPA: tetratricopeptide repeat protein, partial [Methylomirabilota bacterium]|nr:tetratricopeptide repeat protein [Methylomirabilota bacterium]